jgi:hypothetical protein
MVVIRRPKKPKRLSEAELIALTGVSRRNLTRWRQQGLVEPVEARRGRGPGGGRGTKRLEYWDVEVPKINRLKEFKREFKKVIEWRWRLWLYGDHVRIARDLAGVLKRFRTLASKIKNLDDIETKITAIFRKPTDAPRGNPLRVIFRDLSRNDLRSLTTMLICIVLGIRLPLFDEPNPRPFQIFKRAFGLPKEWQMPPGLFNVFPRMLEQVIKGLSTATPNELNGARVVCRFLSRLLNDSENWRRGAIVVSGTVLSWQPIELASLIWPSPVVRAATVGLVILGIRAFKSALGKEAEAALASITSSVSWPGSA